MSTRIKNTKSTLLSDNYYVLRKLVYDYKTRDGQWIEQTREVYDRGDGSCILLYNKEKRTVILTKQFRMPTYQNDNEDGFLVEVCGGLLDRDEPEQCIIRETLEEVGIQLKSAKKVMEAYSSPGVMTEKLYYFVAEYTDDMKVGQGGGLESETEDIEVLEVPFDELRRWMEDGMIQDARTLLLVYYAMSNGLID